jgi:hypothetical protein
MALTTTQLLTQVETAITTILLYGQSYTIGRRTFTRADLDVLRKWRTDLAPQAEAEAQSSNNRNFAGFKRAI